MTSFLTEGKMKLPEVMKLSFATVSEKLFSTVQASGIWWQKDGVHIVIYCMLGKAETGFFLVFQLTNVYQC